MNRPVWIQRGDSRVRDATEQLPHLWGETVKAAETPTSVDTHEVIAQMQAEADQRIAEVEADLSAQVAEALAEADRWRAHALEAEEDARKRGFSAGYADGERQGRYTGEALVTTSSQESIERLASLAEHTVDTFRVTVRDTHQMLATLSIEIARALVGEAFAIDPLLMERRVNRILQHINDAATATVRLHPTDLSLVQAQWAGGERGRRAADQEAKFVADESITPGGCVIEARAHYLDARTETLLDLVAASFAEVNEHLPLSLIEEEDSAERLIDTPETDETEAAA